MQECSPEQSVRISVCQLCVKEVAGLRAGVALLAPRVMAARPLGRLQVRQILFYEDSVAAHLSKILTSDQHPW